MVNICYIYLFVYQLFLFLFFYNFALCNYYLFLVFHLSLILLSIINLNVTRYLIIASDNAIIDTGKLYMVINRQKHQHMIAKYCELTLP